MGSGFRKEKKGPTWASDWLVCWVQSLPEHSVLSSVNCEQVLGSAKKRSLKLNQQGASSLDSEAAGTQCRGFRELWTVAKGVQGSGTKQRPKLNQQEASSLCSETARTHWTMFRELWTNTTGVWGPRNKRKAQIVWVCVLFTGFRDCMNTAYWVQGTLKSYYRGSVFRKRKEGPNWTSKE